MEAETEPENSIEKTINSLLRERKIYQKDLCKHLEISESGIKKMHREQSYKLSTLQKIAEFFKVELIDIIKSKITVEAPLEHKTAEEPQESYTTQNQLSDKERGELYGLRELIHVYRNSNALYEKDNLKLTTENKVLKARIEELTRNKKK
jgi:DNA-binding Xre family transcriptional regulator